MAATAVKYPTMSTKSVSHSLWASLSVFGFMLLTQMSKGNAALAPAEESVLELLRQRFNQPNWTGDPCDSDWVTCSNSSQVSYVEWMNLKNKNLTGTLPTQIAKLQRIQELALSTNMFMGQIPDFSNMTRLTLLDLSDNRLSGRILNTSAFTNISKILLSGNNLSGGIPESLFQHPSATDIRVERNPLGGPIPDMSELRNLTSLFMKETDINGRIPESISNLTRLNTVDIKNNRNLTGVLPDLSRLQSLEFFDVSNCALSGPLPGLESSSSLAGIYLNDNDFRGPIPPALFQHPKLQWLILSNNPRLSGDIPDMSQIYGVEKIEAFGCNFSGPLPSMASSNRLVRFLLLADNRLTSMPSDLRNLTKLAAIDVSNNRMTGTLPDLPARSKQETIDSYFLTDINFANNDFSGGIPESWTELTSVATMHIGHNRLSGRLPAGLGNLTSLQELNVSNNRFTGPIPEDIGRLEELTILDLTNNQFNSTVPESLAGLSKLTTLRLDNNSFTGIPEVLVQRGLQGLLNVTYEGNPNMKIIATNNKSSDLSLGAIIGIVVGALAAAMTILGAVIHMINRRNSKYEDQLLREDMPKSAQAFTLNQIKAITASNKTLIGKGGFGPVYYGKLPDGKEVAVKVRAADSTQGAQEFLNEVRLLSKLHHRNLVPLVGYCMEAHQQILVYHYMPQGTLHEHLYSSGSNNSNPFLTNSTGPATYQPLDWKTRLDIALNAAKGLQYLHKDCNPTVIHRDVKSSNILLTEKLYAKVADLGISKQAPEPDTEEALNTSGVSTAVKGTLGYLDPEYFVRRRLTTKSDVYSFGVVLLEIITGRRPQSQKFPNAAETNLIDWVRRAVNNNQVQSVVDPALEGKYHEEDVLKVARTALSCVSPSGVERPDMGDVINILIEALHCQMEFEGLLDETSNSKPASKGSVAFSGPLETPHSPWTPVSTTVSVEAFSHPSWNTDPR